MGSDIILDCESYATALRSICGIFNLSEESLVNFLKDHTLYDEYNTKYSEITDFNNFLCCTFINEYNIDLTLLKSVYWFHLARTMDHQAYNMGILPLGEVEHKLLEDVYQLVRNAISHEEWKRIVKKLYCFAQHSCRLAKIYHGPYAILIKEQAYHLNEPGHHDYLAVPETIEDLCTVAKEETGIDLLSMFQKASYPIIVKFLTDSQKGHRNIIKDTILYLHKKCLGEKISPEGYGFDSEGKAILPSQIVKIEIVHI